MSATVIPFKRHAPVQGRDDGISDEFTRYMARAAKHLKAAKQALEHAPAPEGSDADLRCQEALEELEGVLYTVQWTPPPDA
jgi:hypothetical protein